MKISNAKLTQIRKLHSRKHREALELFVCEGSRLVSEAIASRLVEYVVAVEEWQGAVISGSTDRFEKDSLHDVDVFEIDEKTFNSLAETQNPQGILAVCRMPKLEMPKDGAFVALDRISDPGNLGTIIRTAESAGIGGVFLSEGCVDLFNAKAVRSTMGAIFRMPVLTNCLLADIIQKNGARGVAMVLDGATGLFEADLRGDIVIVIGSEASGVSDEVRDVCESRVCIPMSGGESLNAAVAAGITMFEWKRQNDTNFN